MGVFLPLMRSATFLGVSSGFIISGPRLVSSVRFRILSFGPQITLAKRRRSERASMELASLALLREREKTRRINLFLGSARCWFLAFFGIHFWSCH